MWDVYKQEMVERKQDQGQEENEGERGSGWGKEMEAMLWGMRNITVDYSLTTGGEESLERMLQEVKEDAIKARNLYVWGVTGK